MTLISPHAIVDPNAVLEEGVSIGPFSVVNSGVKLGWGTSVGSHCVLGSPATSGSETLTIGPQSTIRSHSVIYGGSTIGERLETGHRVTIREGVRAGINLRVGINTEIQGDSTFGDYVRLHSGVFTSKSTTLGNHVWLFPHVVLTDDPHPPNDANMQGATIDDYAVVSAQSCVAPAVRIGHGAVVGAASLVTRDVAPGMLVLGVPAKERGPAKDVLLRDGSGRSAYPWTQHFRRGYPEDVIAEWDERHA